jgi:Flp pilus assembly protein TadD
MLKLRLTCVVITAATAISCASHQGPAYHQPTAFERQIRNAADAGDGDYRIRALRQRVVSEPDNLEIRLELVAAYRSSGQSDLAVEHCRVAASRFPESAPIQLELAKSMRAAGLRKEAVEGLDAFLKVHPQDSPKFLSWVGILRDEMGQLPAGETSHRAALALAPSSDYLRNNLGYNLLMQGKHKEAAAEFQEALKIDPKSDVARNNLGLCLANTVGKEQAVQQLQAGADPATAHNNMAAYLIEQGRYVEARKELSVALGYNNHHPAALRNLELVSRMDGNPATMPARTQPVGTRWDRMKGSFRKLFVGPLHEQPAGAAGAASAN